MKHDIFVGLQRIIDKDCALVRVLNQAGVPYSIILEQQPNGEFWEVCCTPTLGDNDSISESKMINKYLATKELGQKQLGGKEMQIDIEPCTNLIPDVVELKDIKGFVDHLDDEVKEVLDALIEFSTEKDGKSREALAEELVDVMTMALTCLASLQNMKGSPKLLAFAAMDKVLYKNYGRGYHNNSVRLAYCPPSASKIDEN